MATKIQLRRGTASQWSTANPVLAQGEQGYETDTKKLKIGDGTTTWNSLAYFAGSGTGTGGVTSVAGRTGDVTLTKSDVGLGNVDNTSDVDKPISTATQTALNAKPSIIVLNPLDAEPSASTLADNTLVVRLTEAA